MKTSRWQQRRSFAVAECLACRSRTNRARRRNRFTHRTRCRISRVVNSRLRELEQYIELRKEYSEKLFEFFKWWTIGLAAVLIWSEIPSPFAVATADELWAAAFFNWFFAFDLDTNLLIALVGGSTASVIGMIVVVAKFLFPSEHNPSRDWAGDARPRRRPKS